MPPFIATPATSQANQAKTPLSVVEKPKKVQTRQPKSFFKRITTVRSANPIQVPTLANHTASPLSTDLKTLTMPAPKQSKSNRNGRNYRQKYTQSFEQNPQNSKTKQANTNSKTTLPPALVLLVTRLAQLKKQLVKRAILSDFFGVWVFLGLVAFLISLIFIAKELILLFFL